MTSIFSRVTRQFVRSRRLVLVVGLLLPLLGTSSFSVADDATPTATVKTAVDKILGILRKPDYNFEKDRSSISAEIRKAFDDVAMAQSVLSTNWKSINADQQNTFKDLLSQTVENNYIGRLKSYNNEKVEIRKEEVKDTLATVDSVVVAKSGDIPVNYKLRKRKDGWFIYDVVVENVSMVSTYRDTYRPIFSKDGIDGLLKQMKAKIAELGG